MTLKHSFNSLIADDGAASAAGEVLPSHWNADHAISGDARGNLFNNAGVIGTDPQWIFGPFGTFAPTDLKRVRIGPDEASMDAVLSEYTVPRLLVTAKDIGHFGSGIGVQMQSSTEDVNGVYFAGKTTLANSSNGAFEGDFYIGANGAKVYNYGNYTEISAGIAADYVRGFFITAPVLKAGATLDIFGALYMTDAAGCATNPYYLWADSRGVFRIKEDNTFDSVGQGIATLYNPQFTKYTAGAVNFERIVLARWNGNVAEIGAEQGGTGTLRPLNLIGSALTFNGAALASNPFSDAAALVKNAADATKLAKFSAASITTGTTRTYTLPNVSDTLAVLGANSFIGIQTVTPAANAKGIVFGSATHTLSSPAIDIAQTWNDGSVIFTAMKINATSTASAGGSLLLDLQIGGSSKATVNKAGVILGTSLQASSDITLTTNGAYFQFGTRFYMDTPADGKITFHNNAGTDFGMLLLGGTSSSFPALKRSATSIAVRLADDSADAPLSCSILTVADANGKYIQTPGMTVANLPAAPARGMRCYVTDSNAASYTLGIGATVAGGGTTVVPVFYDGAAWKIG